MAHSISLKILEHATDRVTVELSGAFEPVHGIEGKVGEYARSIPYMLNYGRRIIIERAGAAAKGTPEADIKAARRDKDAKLRAGDTGGTGGTRVALWVRLAAATLRAIAPDDAKPGDVHLALQRDDAKVWARWAKARKLNPEKVAAKVAGAIDEAKAEQARREAADAASNVDLADLA